MKEYALTDEGQLDEALQAAKRHRNLSEDLDNIHEEMVYIPDVLWNDIPIIQEAVDLHLFFLQIEHTATLIEMGRIKKQHHLQIGGRDGINRTGRIIELRPPTDNTPPTDPWGRPNMMIVVYNDEINAWIGNKNVPLLRAEYDILPMGLKEFYGRIVQNSTEFDEKIEKIRSAHRFFTPESTQEISQTTE